MDLGVTRLWRSAMLPCFLTLMAFGLNSRYLSEATRLTLTYVLCPRPNHSTLLQKRSHLISHLVDRSVGTACTDVAMWAHWLSKVQPGYGHILSG